MGTLAKVSKQFKKNTLVKTKETIQRHIIKTILKTTKNTHTAAEYAYKNSPAPNQNIDKVTDIIPDSHLASRGPFKGTGMLLRAQLGGRTSQETPSHHRQGADRRWNEVLIMLPSDIIYIYITLYYITIYYVEISIIVLIIYVLLFLFEISFLSLLVTVGCSCSAMLHAAHGSPYQCSQLITCGIRQALNDLNDPGITMLKILS